LYFYKDVGEHFGWKLSEENGIVIKKENLLSRLPIFDAAEEEDVFHKYKPCFSIIMEKTFRKKT